jgi:hypothetical protein
VRWTQSHSTTNESRSSCLTLEITHYHGSY